MNDREKLKDLSNVILESLNYSDLFRIVEMRINDLNEETVKKIVNDISKEVKKW